MTMAVRRNFALSMMVALVFAVLCMFATPTVSHATNNDPNAVNVSVDASGNLSVKGGGFDDAGSASAWNAFIVKYKNFITGIAGIGAVTMVILFIVQFMKLGASAGNPNARSQALVGVLWTGIAAAGLGAVTLIVGFFYNAF